MIDAALLFVGIAAFWAGVIISIALDYWHGRRKEKETETWRKEHPEHEWPTY